MEKSRNICFAILTPLWLAFLASVHCSVIVIDPIRGLDNNDCLTQAGTQSCKTLQHALGNVSCDCTRITASNAVTFENLVIELADGLHVIEECVGITYGRNVTIKAVNPRQAIVECGRFPSENRFETGLKSCNTNDLTFQGILFRHCGPYTPNIFLNRSTNVLFEDCIFRDNIGAPLKTQFVPSIILRNVSFLDNFNRAPADTDTENTTISELFDSITTAGGFTYFSRNVSVDIEIENCTFVNNSAGQNDVNNTRPVLLKANGHGGGVLIRLAQAEGARIVITNSVFSGNEAEVDGGALYFSLSEEFSSSQIILQNNKFVSNRVNVSAGGAVSLNLFRNTFNNSFKMSDCEFSNNSANAGGAFGIALYDTGMKSIEQPDSAWLERCNFVGNQASNEGTAVGLFALVHVDEVGFPVTFTDCHFDNNTSEGATAEHSSALVAFRFPVTFQGHNSFYGNRGGGVTLLNTILRANGTILFESNSATFGGGLAMDDRCLVEVHPNVNLSFVNNRAEETGGGIHVTFPAIRYTTDIFNRLCFLQYRNPNGGDLPPHRWENVTISFYNNYARLSGAALYASDLQLCSWLGPEYTTAGSIIFNYPENATDSSPFLYEGNSVQVKGQKDERLATAPHRVHAIPDHDFVQPGETVILNMLATDQLNNSREAIFSLEGPHGTDTVDGLSTNNESVPYRVPAVQSLLGRTDSCHPLDSRTNGSFTLTFSLPGTSGLVESVEFDYEGCHPGYALDENSCVCRCDTDEGNIVRCDNEGRYVYLRSGVWAGVNAERDLITSRVQPSYVNCSRDGQLPGCLYKFDDPNAQCSQGREGILCGQCTEGYAVTLDLLRCTSAQDQCAVGLAVFLMLYVVVVIIALLALIFNKELPNELKGFVFYAQVIGLVYQPFVILQTSDSSIDPLGVFLNLLGSSLPLPVCVSPSLQAHHIALLGYVTPIIGGIIVVGYAIGARCISLLSNHSALKGITFLSIFIYKYIADTSFVLISCSSDSDYGLVFQYDGSLSCTGIEFGLFVLFGLAVVILLVAPAPFAVGYICTKRPQRFQHYADVLTKGLKSDKRWFGGWDLGRRLPFVIIGYFTVQARPSLVLFLMSLVAMAVLLVHLLSKPYERKVVNVIEALILTDLVAVTVVFIDPIDHPVPQWLRIILLILPYIYAMLYIVWVATWFVWRKYLSQMKCCVLLVKKVRGVSDRTRSVTEVALVDTASLDTASPQNNTQENTQRDSGNSTGSRDSDRGSNKVKRDPFQESCSHLREPLLDT